METTHTIEKTKRQNLLSNINKFWYTNYYFVLIGLLSFVFWCSNLSSVGIALLMLVGTLVAFTCKDSAPLLPLLPLMVVSVSKTDFMTSTTDLAVVITFGVIFAISIIYNLARFKHPVSKGQLTLPLILVSIALILGGIGYADAKSYANGILFIFCLGPLMLVLYSFAISRMDLPSEVDHKKYFAKIVAICTIVCAGEVVVAQLRVEGDILNHVRAVLSVGWANRASLVMVLVLGLSSVFYLAENCKRAHFFAYLGAFAIFICLILTFGRGGIIFGTLELIAIVICLLIKGKHKRPLLLCIATGILILLIGCIIYWDSMVLILNKLHDLGLNSSGRTNIYKEGWECFLRSPLFGVGLGFIDVNTTHNIPNVIFWFHSTPIQVIASMGVFGLVCYAYYYVKRIQILKKNKSNFTLFMAFGIIALELHCLIDAGTFQPFPYVYYLIMMHAFIEYDTKKQQIQIG